MAALHSFLFWRTETERIMAESKLHRAKQEGEDFFNMLVGGNLHTFIYLKLSILFEGFCYNCHLFALSNVEKSHLV